MTPSPWRTATLACPSSWRARTGKSACPPLIAAFLLFIPTLASACPVCFGDPNSAMVKGTNNGIFFLLGVIGFVQVGLGAMFVAFWRRARALRARRDSMRVINGGLFR